MLNGIQTNRTVSEKQHYQQNWSTNRIQILNLNLLHIRCWF